MQYSVFLYFSFIYLLFLYFLRFEKKNCIKQVLNSLEFLTFFSGFVVSLNKTTDWVRVK